AANPPRTATFRMKTICTALEGHLSPICWIGIDLIPYRADGTTRTNQQILQCNIGLSVADGRAGGSKTAMEMHPVSAFRSSANGTTAGEPVFGASAATVSIGCEAPLVN